MTRGEERIMADLQKEWHLDRKVTLSLILAIMINAGSSVWWAASLNAQVLNQRKEIDTHTAQINQIIMVQGGVGERLAKIEAGINYQTKVLDRMEDKAKGK
jgi:hypothetical protein